MAQLGNRSVKQIYKCMSVLNIFGSSITQDSIACMDGSTVIGRLFMYATSSMHHIYGLDIMVHKALPHGSIAACNIQQLCSCRKHTDKGTKHWQDNHVLLQRQ